METNERNSTEFWWGKWPRCDTEAANSMRIGHVCDLRARSAKHHACTQWACSEAQLTKQGLETEGQGGESVQENLGTSGAGQAHLSSHLGGSRDPGTFLRWFPA